MKKILMSAGCLFLSCSVFAIPDKTEVVEDVHLESSKVDSVRTYSAKLEKKLPFPIELVKKGITNFTDQCNNDLKDKRKYTAKEAHCKYNNENVVETFNVPNMVETEELKNYQEHYLIGRHIYNRGNYEFYELVTVKEDLNRQGQKTIRIVQKMLSDKEAKTYTSPQLSLDSNFQTRSTIYTLTQLNDHETLLQYDYVAETDHWLLNKQLSVPQVFAYLTQGIHAFVNNIEEQSLMNKREVASK